MAVILILLVCLSGRQALAQSLIDLLTAKGLITKSEAQKLKSSGKGRETEDVQGLVGLLKAKGILTDQDLAHLREPSAPASEIDERLLRIETHR